MRFLTLLLSFALIMGCAASKKVGPSAQKENGKALKALPAGQYDESFDPLTLEDDDISIPKNNTNSQRQSPFLKNVTSESSEQSVPDSLKSFKEADGYRVQIFAGRDIQAATLTETEAQETFAKRGLKVYLIFEAPFYKVRVGDFTDRDDAENARELVKQLGYKSAFVVRSKVRVPVQ